MGVVTIDRKLALTAAALGTRTRKELAAAFRAANPRTGFDVERANKWLQGRARPREQSIYEDWAAVLGLGRSGAWIAECDLASFVAALAAATGEAAEVLERRASAFAAPPSRGLADAAASFEGDLAGTYLCYSAAWSPYFEGRLVRGVLDFERQAGGLAARYTQSRTQDSITAQGQVDVLARGMLMHLREPHGRTGFVFTLFPPMSLVSVLGGIVGGIAMLGADPRPSVSRIVMVRVAVERQGLLGPDCLLDADASIAADLAALGAPLAEPGEADRRIAAFFATGAGAGTGIDAAAIAAYHAVVELFDREWIRTGFPDGRQPPRGRSSR